MSDLIAERWELSPLDMAALKAAREAGLTFARIMGKSLFCVGAGRFACPDATHQWDSGTGRWERL